MHIDLINMFLFKLQNNNLSFQLEYFRFIYLFGFVYVAASFQLNDKIFLLLFVLPAVVHRCSPFQIDHVPFGRN